MFGENLLSVIINAILAVVFTILIWLLPGIRLLPEKLKLPLSDRLFLGVTFSFALYVLAIFVVRLIGLPFWLAQTPFLVLGLLEGRRWLKKRTPQMRRPTPAQIVFLILTLVGVGIQGSVLFRSGLRVEEGLQFGELSLHDSTWHLFLIDELKQGFPPRHPGFAPALVKNYHFLLDLVLASIASYLPISTFDLYYRITPVAVSTLLSLSIFVVTRRLTRSQWQANVAVFLGLFSGNASWVVKFFRGPEFHPSANTFMLDPILDLMQNPHAVIVFPLLLAGLYGLLLSEKKSNPRIAVLTAISFGVMIGFKSWGGLLVLLSLPAGALLMSLRKIHAWWAIWTLSLLVAILIFVPFYDGTTAARPVFVPGWLLKRMVEDPDRYNAPQYFFLEQHYRATQNVLRLGILNLEQVLLFLFGNLWVKILGLFQVWAIVRRPTATRVVILAITTASLALPLLFNQGRMSYDIIQFGPYALLLLSMFTAMTLGKLAEYFPKKLMLLFTLLILILSVPSNAKSVVDRLNDSLLYVSNQELSAMEFLRSNTDPESIVLLYPSKENISSALVAALSQRPTFFSANTFSRITGEDYEGREAELRKFFSNLDPEFRSKIIKTNSIDYLFLRRQENERFNPSGVSATIVYENESAIIYKFN